MQYAIPQGIARKNYELISFGNACGVGMSTKRLRRGAR